MVRCLFIVNFKFVTAHFSFLNRSKSFDKTRNSKQNHEENSTIFSFDILNTYTFYVLFFS